MRQNTLKGDYAVSKVATIVPRSHLHVTQDNDYFMALSYAADHQDYADFFKARAEEGKFVMLDNSAIEMGKPEMFDRYLRKAKQMRVSEIMLPDIFKSPFGTFSTALEVLRTWSPDIVREGFKVMVIPQGQTTKEWFTNLRNLMGLCVSYVMQTPTIGISYRYNEMFGGDRRTAVDLALAVAEEVHLLGCKEDPRYHIAPLLQMEGVRGVDSAYPTVYAAHGLELWPDKFANPRPARIVNFTQDIYEESLLASNIRVWREACGVA